MSSDILSNREIRRYQNQIALPDIGLEGQEKIKKSRVVVIGTGGIGTSTMQHLVAAGMGTLGIIDNAMVEESNIHRQTLYGTSDLGKQKAIITKQKLQELNAQVKLNIHNLCISFDNIDQICSQYDIIVDASNFWESNKAIWSYCNTCKIPMVFARINEYLIEIGSFTDCKLLQDYIDQGEKFVYELKDGFLSSIAGIAGSLVSLEVIRIITGKTGNNLNKAVKIDIQSLLS